MIEDNVHQIEIQESYRNYSPPVWVKKTVDRLIYRTPKKYLAGLGTVLLTNSDDLNRSERHQKITSRKRKVLVRESRGMYYQRWNGQEASIKLLVDNIINSWPATPLKWSFFRDIIFAEVLYHELGHHIHKTTAPEYKEPEDVADRWGKKLCGSYVRRQYWYLMPLIVTLRSIVHVYRKVLKFRSGSGALDKGQMKE
jgi:hypothetical protein